MGGTEVPPIVLPVTRDVLFEPSGEPPGAANRQLDTKVKTA